MYNYISKQSCGSNQFWAPLGPMNNFLKPISILILRDCLYDPCKFHILITHVNQHRLYMKIDAFLGLMNDLDGEIWF